MTPPATFERERRPVVHREPGPRPGAPDRAARPVLITGGAGFIGCNLAHRLLAAGRPVLLFDNLSRPGVERNLRWLRETHRGRVPIEVADVRNAEAVRAAVARASAVFHFAAQVAVTTSLVDPAVDFAVNAGGTLNVLEALRSLPAPPPLVFTSTNKVYGGLDDVRLVCRSGRYEPRAGRLREHGVSEQRPLDFHSPYGCSKGTADQYVRDYSRSFGLRTIVFRMSCIYGPHQCGTEDQGWIAHFLIRTLDDQPIVLYGDGRQVRDVLFIDDLVQALLLAERHMDTQAGRAFNIGGGPAQTISLLELLALIEALHGTRPAVTVEGWRTGDQRYYVSDTRAFTAATGWRPRTSVREGVRRLYDWLVATRLPARAVATVKRPAAAAASTAAGRAVAAAAGEEEVA